ncbi:MAG TPA: CBS domain-containing protein [Nitrospiraceae bacterium]|nr:CBS domain-containing protein [Nitrospiraceae bacterium]
MGKGEIVRLPRTVMSSKPSSNDRTPMKTGGRKRSGIYLESTEDEQLGVLPHECTRVKDAMSRSVSVVTPLTEIAEAVQLMKSLDIGALVVCNGSSLVGTLCDRDIALANMPPSAAIQEVITYNSAYCLETDLLIDAQEMMRARGLAALPVRDSSGLLSGVLMKVMGTTVIFLFLVPLIVAFWLSVAWSADVTPVPSPPLGLRPDNSQEPNTTPSRIDPGIERRPQTIPDPRSAVTPPNVDPKMTIDPETAPPAMEKLKPGGSEGLPRKPSPR